MMNDGRSHGLLAAIAPRFTRELENVATEALCYVIERSERAEQAFRSLIERTSGTSFPEKLCWRTQSGGEDRAIPDVVGEDPAGRPRVIIEAKFWAELTSNQPATYLERLRVGDEGGVLLFVVPNVRLEVLWQEIRRACPVDVALGSEEIRRTETRCAPVMGKHRLAIVSWSLVIETLRSETAAAGESRLMADIEQLRGLVDRVDEEAFLPLWPEDLAKQMPRRILQFRDLVQDSVAALTAKGANHLGMKRRKWASGVGWFGIYVDIRRPLLGLLYFSAVRWAENGISPLWLQLTTEGIWKCPADVRERLRRISFEEPRKWIEDDWGPTIPIALPTGVEKEHVVRAIVTEVTRVATAALGSSDGHPAEPGPEADAARAALPAPGETSVGIDERSGPGVPAVGDASEAI